jgi:WhiB family redox-sensing transcriptional regulator
VTHWQDDALCTQADASLFFPLHRGDNMNDARRLCSHCPVRLECLNEAMDLRDYHGFRGGMSGEERRHHATATRRTDLTPEVLRLAAKNWTAQAIALRLGVDDSLVYRVLKDHREGQVVA